MRTQIFPDTECDFVLEGQPLVLSDSEEAIAIVTPSNETIAGTPSLRITTLRRKRTPLSAQALLFFFYVPHSA